MTSIGHRFGHQSDLYEGSERNSTIYQHGFVFRIYLVFSKTDTNTTYRVKCKCLYCKKLTCLERGCCFIHKYNKKHMRQACAAVNGAWGHQYIKLFVIFINMYYYTILVLLISIISIAYWLPTPTRHSYMRPLAPQTKCKVWSP